MTSQLTRRELVQRGAAGFALLSVPGFVAACGGGSGGGTGAADELRDNLRFANWPLYIDWIEETNEYPTLDAFTAQTGIKVDYTEEINDNAQYFGKIQGPLSQGRGIDRDLIVLTDNSRFPGLLIERGWAQKLDTDLIPNMSNLITAQQHPPFDPNREYSLPWQSGMTGIAWNEDVTGPVTTIEQLLTDPALKGKITMLMELADSVGVVMLSNGDDPTKVTQEAYDAALAKIQAGVDSGQIRKFTGNDYAPLLAKGDIAAAVAWSGDIVQLQPSNDKLKWAIPEDGGMIWTDNMLIPQGGSVATASTYMNYVYDPAVAAEIAAYINYVTPVKGAKEELAKTDPETAENPLIFPTDEMLSQVRQFDSAALNNEDYIEAWQTVLGA